MITPKFLPMYIKTNQICKICNRSISSPDKAEIVITKRKSALVMHTACIVNENLRRM